MRLFEVTKLRIWKQLTTITKNRKISIGLFEVTKLRIWKQFTTQRYVSAHAIGCLRSQNYEFESNSQHFAQGDIVRQVVWDHKITNLKTIHNVPKAINKRPKLFEITKLRIWKQFTTKRICGIFSCRLFEVTKLRIWKQLTTNLVLKAERAVLFEVTKLRIWKQLTTRSKVCASLMCCLRSQSYEFESNSQLSSEVIQKLCSCLRS